MGILAIFSYPPLFFQPCLKHIFNVILIGLLQSFLSSPQWASPQTMTANMSGWPGPLNPDLSINSKHAKTSTKKKHNIDNEKGTASEIVRHMTCIKMGMFPIMREEECAKWKAGCCASERVILKGNARVKGKAIPCMLSLIKYVAQRKCALSYSLARPPLAARSKRCPQHQYSGQNS